MGKKQPIVNHGMLHDSINYSALIEAQATMPAFGEEKKEDRPKVKSLGKKPNYKRTTNK